MRGVPRALRALRDYARDAAGAFRLAPVEVLLGVGVAAAFSASARADGDGDWWWRIAAPALLAFLLVFAASLLRARGAIDDRLRWGATAAVLLLAAGYGARVFHPDRDTEGWRWLGLFGAAGLALTFAPVVGVESRDARRERYWRFAFALKARLLTVLAYGLALWVALAGAVAAVTSLFELETPEHLHGDIFGWIFFALVPWVVVGGIPELVAAPGREEPAPRSLRLLGRYLYVPVLAVYLAILLAYVGKVVVTGEFPRNLLSPIVLVAGLGGLLGSVFLEPLRRDPEHAGVARLVRLLPLLLLPLLPFALRAVWVRTQQYGWTEPRYLRLLLLVALTGLCLAGAVRFFRGREPLLLTVPLVLGAALLLGAVGPWSASAVSRRDQAARLREALREAGVMEGGRLAAPIVPEEERKETLGVTQELHGRIADGARYLYEAHGPGPVGRVLGRDVSGFDDGWALHRALPLKVACAARERWSAAATLPDSAPVPRLMGGTLYRVSESARSAAPRHPAREGVAFYVEAADLLVLGRSGVGTWAARVALAPLLARLVRAASRECEERVAHSLTPDEARHPLVDAAGRVRGQVVLTTVVAEAAGGGREVRLGHATGMVLVAE